MEPRQSRILIAYGWLPNRKCKPLFGLPTRASQAVAGLQVEFLVNRVSSQVVSCKYPDLHAGRPQGKLRGCGAIRDSAASSMAAGRGEGGGHQISCVKPKIPNIISRYV